MILKIGLTIAIFAAFVFVPYWFGEWLVGVLDLYLSPEKNGDIPGIWFLGVGAVFVGAILAFFSVVIAHDLWGGDKDE